MAPYYLLASRARMYPLNYPVLDFYLELNEQQVAKFVWDYEEAAKKIGQKYDVSNWIGVNQIVTIDWKDWLNLEPLIKKAICLEVEGIVNERNNKTLERERKMEMQMAQTNSKLNFLDTSQSAVSKMFSKM